jgi:aerobic-type carbon monoxide dehydrogenase small subunit (CoxS/CutS family)
MSNLELAINGEERTIDVDLHRPLRDVLRQELGLTGTKDSCDSGVCGVCTVLVDGDARKSCLLPAGKVAGAEITTIEGMAEDGELGDVQAAFADAFASQCGYCMPGFVLAAEGLLADEPNPSASEIRARISGNVCRCTGYVKIVAAIQDAADRRADGTGVDRESNPERER